MISMRGFGDVLTLNLIDEPRLKNRETKICVFPIRSRSLIEKGREKREIIINY